MTDMLELGRIEMIDLREAWTNEATEFTPWLAENLSELSNAMGIELELETQEASVGSFSLDLLARVSETDRTVVIENQLESTDHDHLGKLLTYAGGFDANVIVWVAKSFNDKHRQALDWLNQRTDKDTEFFGVVVEVWKINDSIPAPHFRVVAAPNEWQREAAGSVRIRNASDRNLKYKEFFQNLIDRLRKENFTNARKAQPQSWYFFSVGHSQRIQYGVNFTKNNNVSVHIRFDNLNADWNKTLFDKLVEQKESVESELSESLHWQRMDDYRASRIAVLHPGNIDEDDESLKELENWIVGKLLSFQRVFKPKLEALATESRSSS